MIEEDICAIFGIMQLDSGNLLEQAALTGGIIFLSYLIGAIPTGFLLARRKGIDIRKVGSGNIGATNVYRCVGKSWGILTFILDFLKGYLPAALFPLMVRHQASELSGVTLSLICGCLAVVGHNWPVYLRFRGGKGMATSAGALFGFAPLIMLIGLISWLVCFAASRYVSLASIFAALVIAVSSWRVYSENMLVPAALSVMSVIVIWRHQSNIKRLLAGTEHRFKL